LPTIEELLGQSQSSLHGALNAGVTSLSAGQVVTFTRYVRVVLPIDGYAFWVKADILTPSAVYNSLQLGAVTPNAAPGTAAPAAQIQATGSLHFHSENVQDEDNTYWLNRVIFTTDSPIETGFVTAGENELYIGEFAVRQDPAQVLKFAFARQDGWYDEAGYWHYKGEAIYPFMASQVIDSAQSLSLRQVVSNSLPLWMNLNGYTPFYGFSNHVPLYPSSLVLSNARPPYGAIHVDSHSTRALGAAPYLHRNSSHEQLCTDRVRITLYGLRNDEAQDFVDCVNQYSEDYSYIGMMSSPVLRDEQRGQNELNTLAIKKTLEYEVSYIQSSARDIARQIIGRAIVDYEPTQDLTGANL
jgi:hypothetical protein